MTFIEMLNSSWQKNNSLLCVGLDPDISKIPPHIKSSEMPLFDFNRAIIDRTADLVCAFKPQIAYYAAFGLERDLEMTIGYIHEKHPGIPVILDAKRGDIGSTATMYAQEAFDRYGADAVTVNPYMGSDTLTPFLKHSDKGVVILCRTSNPGGGDFQNLETNDLKLYQNVAKKATNEWNTHGNVLLVVGATYPEELGEIRAIVKDMPLLVPGIGAQGGDVRKAVQNGINQHGTGMIINSSRGIIYAGSGQEFAEDARNAAIKLKGTINQYR